MVQPYDILWVPPQIYKVLKSQPHTITVLITRSACSKPALDDHQPVKPMNELLADDSTRQMKSTSMVGIYILSYIKLYVYM